MWIESHQSLAGHPKLKRLARKLGISKHEAIGILHLLWWWALDYAPTGCIIPPFDAEDIADAVEWAGDAGELIEALEYAGFVDDADDVLVIHDWHDYAGRLLEKREKDRLRKEAKRKTDLEKAALGKQ